MPLTRILWEYDNRLKEKAVCLVCDTPPYFDRTLWNVGYSMASRRVFDSSMACLIFSGEACSSSIWTAW